MTTLATLLLAALLLLPGALLTRLLPPEAAMTTPTKETRVNIIDTFDAARRAGMSATSAARYVAYLLRIGPLDLSEAAAAVKAARERK